MPVSKSEALLRSLLEPAGVEINGSHPWDIQVHDPRFFDRLFTEVTLAAGESYMDGWWDCPALDEMISRALKADLITRIKGDHRVIPVRQGITESVHQCCAFTLVGFLPYHLGSRFPRHL